MCAYITIMSQRAISYMSASNCTCRIYNGSNRDCQESVVDAYLSAVSNCCVSRHARLSPFTFSSSPHVNFPFVLIAHTRFLICITCTWGAPLLFLFFLLILYLSRLPSLSLFFINIAILYQCSSFHFYPSISRDIHFSFLNRVSRLVRTMSKPRMRVGESYEEAE